MISSQIIPPSFQDIYGDDQYYIFYTCLNELRFNTSSLVDPITDKNSQSSRAIIHQMISTSTIIFHSRINFLIKELQDIIRNELWDENPLKILKELDKTITEVYTSLGSEKLPLKIIILSENKSLGTKFLSLINNWHQSANAELFFEWNDFSRILMKSNPDLIFILDEKCYEELISEDIQFKFLGTSFCYIQEEMLEDQNSKALLEQLENLRVFRKTRTITSYQ